MPLDVYAALGALVRAEARRTKPVPAPTPADHAAKQQPSTPVPPPAEPPAEPSAEPPADLSAEPPADLSAESPAEAPPEPPAAATAAPSSARKSLLLRMIHRLTAFFGRRRRTGSGAEGPRRPVRGPGPDGPGADRPGADRPECHRRRDGARPAEPPSGSPLA
ncbi:hypothetical protein OHS81_33895 [Streptomyces sp. NBC_00400]|uniref:hypothetical protein n=1 Tax=Streptomyces sp. NBC_00400 TaxID=2975737 RepID=UPI002E1D7089